MISNKQNLIIHIGYHKTATTWIQEKILPTSIDSHFLGKCNEKKNEIFIKFIHYLIYTSDEDYSSTKCMEYLFKAINFQKKQDLKPYNNVIFSDEALSGGVDWFGSSSFRVADRLRELTNGFATVKILIGIRKPSKLIKSFYVEYIRRGGSLTFEQLFTLPNQPGQYIYSKLNFRQLIQRYQKLFGDENVVIYKMDDIINLQKFLEKLSFKLKIEFNIREDIKSSLNKSMSIISLELLRILNKLFLGPFNNNPVLPIHHLMVMIAYLTGIIFKNSDSAGLQRFKKMKYYEKVLFSNNKSRTYIIKFLEYIFSKTRKFNINLDKINFEKIEYLDKQYHQLDKEKIE